MKLVKITQTLAIIFAVVLPLGMRAGTIEYSSQIGAIQNSNGTNSADNNIVELGTFTPGFNFSTNTSYAQLVAGFTLYDTTTIQSAGQFYNNPTWLGSASIPLYIWCFNVASNVSSATQWAIITNPGWVTPSSASLSSSVIDTADSGTVIPTGAAGQVVGSNIKMTAAVPEPTSIALLGGGLMMLGSMVRRRK